MATRVSLTGVAVSDGYQQTLIVDDSNGIESTEHSVGDGDGTASCLDLGTDGATITGTLNVGDGTNDVKIEADGDVLFVGGGGLHFGEVYVVGNANASVLNSAAKVQFVHFDTDGASNGNITPAHGQDHITIGVAGMYLVTANLHIQNNAAQSHLISVDVYYNNGDTAVANVHCHGNLTGGLTDIISMSVSGIADLPAAATLEMWLNTDSGANRSITVVDCTLTAVQIGGT